MFSRAVNNLRTIAVYLHVANNMNVDDILGLIGGFILGVQLLPQIYTTIKQRDARNISSVYLSLKICGLSLMTFYAVKTNQISLYIPTSTSICLSLTLLSLKWYYDSIQKNVENEIHIAI
jgi:MtN3 and saliva related transmembrane protein